MRVWFDRRCLSGSLHCDSVLLCIIFHHFASSHFSEVFCVSRRTFTSSRFHGVDICVSRIAEEFWIIDTGKQWKQHRLVFRFQIIIVVINNHFFKVFKVSIGKRWLLKVFKVALNIFKVFKVVKVSRSCICTLWICRRTCSECYKGSERDIREIEMYHRKQIYVWVRSSRVQTKDSRGVR